MSVTTDDDRAQRKRRKHASQPGCHSHADRGDDFYPTPKIAIDKLLEVEQLKGSVADVSCGGGTITMTLRAAGYVVHASDLHDRGCPNSRSGVDFLRLKRLPPDVKTICINPPFMRAAEFVRHGLQLVPTTIVLARLAFLESEGRSDILEGPLSRVHAFRKRLRGMHRHDWSGPKVSPSMAFCWCVFEGDHTGPALLDRI
jgi:hypothetical protein